jgi:hypothetical protein
MLAATATVGWSFNAASATLAGADRLILQGALENRSRKPVSLTLLPLVAEGWRPVHVLPSVEVAAGGKQEIQIEYALAEGADASLVESFVRLPVLVRAGSHCGIADLRGPVTPMALVWEPQTFFNQDGPFLANCRVVNNSEKEFSGIWEARLGDQTLKGSFTAKAHAAFPLDLRFDLPRNLQEPALLPLTVTVEHEGHRVTSRRRVEFVRNIGLAETVPLHPVTKAKGQADARVSFKPAADERRLTLNVVVGDPSLLQGTPEAGPAWQLDLNLDARSYGKRLEHGATGTLRISGTAADGPATVHDIPPWAFGNGYASGFDPKALSADLTTAADGSRTISVSIPRSYLYLHEWALDNGNSQLGLNLRLTLRQAPLGGQEALVSYTLTQNTKPPEDVDSLAVLELTEKPTKRLTVNVY